MEEVSTAYFDNAATTFPKPEVVYDFMDSFYRRFGVNVGRGAYDQSIAASKIVRETRDLLKQLFHCPSKKVIFQPSATQAINTILRGISWREGENVYISPFEHNAVTRTLNYISSQYHIRVFELPVDRDTMQYDVERMDSLFISNPPDVVVVSGASNVCGIIAPLETIFTKAKKFNAITVADLAQMAGLVDIDLIKCQADYAVFAGHKTLYGPFGVSGFIAPADISVKPLIYGGTGIESANPLMPESIPEKYEAGSQNVMAIAGLHASLRWILDLGIDCIRRKEQENTEKLLRLLKEYDFVRIIGENNNSVGVVSCVFAGYSSDSMGEVFSNLGIACRVGLHCAPNAHKFLGTFPAGTVRFSVSYFTNDSDFRSLKNALDYIKENG